MLAKQYDLAVGTLRKSVELERRRSSTMVEPRESLEFAEQKVLTQKLNDMNSLLQILQLTVREVLSLEQ